MIKKLKGIIDSIANDSAILDVGGVGYGVFCSSNTIARLPKAGEAVSLFIETHVREDHIHLYGFATAQEQEAFQILIKVSGVGAKMALAILSVLSPEQLAVAIAAQDKNAFKIVSGVGPKLAARIVTELKGKFDFGADIVAPIAGVGDTGVLSSVNNDINDAISALVNLGYGRSEAYSAVTKVAAKNDNAPIDDLIRFGLKELVGG